MIVYTLKVERMAFNGTDCDSSYYKEDILVSKHRERLEEVRRMLEGADYKSICREYFNKDYRNRGKAETIFITSFGEVTVPIHGDSYYGSGRVTGYSIEESRYLDPSEFV